MNEVENIQPTEAETAVVKNADNITDAANYSALLSRGEHDIVNYFLNFCRETDLISEETKESFSGEPKNNPDPEKWYLFNDKISLITYVFPALREAVKLHNLVKTVKAGKVAERTLQEMIHR